MIDDLILNYILLFVFLETYEIWWQRASSIMGMIIKMQRYYSKSIFLFLLMHPTFYFAIGFALLSEYNLYAMILLLLKTADIATKILLIEQIFTKKKLSHELSLVLLAPIDSFLPYMGLFIYPFLIYLAI
ncbi:hypothetical protein Suden_0921 [Sulfurimonas denitrificans DSM 1251]|uniref:Uncharacterized protein n=1 Tax=Sulfurimonas denitrificans (strain ATCC 33889 / DSM 1251) TaxID=326298 RepID=Q30S32_SULDN|nr:hypothetical protein [Sulfurimonas denitrificans]ABB44199.1 hypothetical protein Suden_0921 [Sulfurimonas denitrificans DSM 1251]MDD3441792.1 hypothetical protein [Sulfurimonas denitrificans]